MILQLIYLLFGDWLLSFLAASLFVAHPIHTGAISYISGRADPLAMVFMMMSYIFYIKFVRMGKPGYLLLTAAGLLLAVFSRENSLILPALFLIAGTTPAFSSVPIYDRRRRVAIGLSAASAISLVYLFLRTEVFRFALPHMAHTSTVLQRLPGFFVALTNYLRLLIFPFGLHMEYGDDLYSLADPRAICGIIICAIILITIFKTRKSANVISFAASWFFIALLPASNLYPIDNYMAEHWLYLPSIGFFLILAFVIARPRSGRSNLAMTVAAIALILFYAVLTIRQNSYWRNDLTFYKWTLEHSPRSVRALNNLANAYDKLGKREEVVSLYEEAIRLAPAFPTTYFNYANYYNRVGEALKAIELYEKAVRLNPNFLEAYNNLGSAYDHALRYKEAIEEYKKVIAINPDFAPAYYNLAAACLHSGDRKSADEYYGMAVKLGEKLAKP